MKNKINLIAEIGVNHNGKIDVAKKMIALAKKSECDFVKFQLFKAENLVKKNTVLANYQKKNSLNSKTQFDMLKKLELNYEDLKKLKKYSDKKKINFLCTAFDLESLKFLYNRLKLKFIKISSTDLDNYPMLFYAGKKFNKIFLSTGLADIKKVDLALKVLYFSKKYKNFESCSKIILKKKKIDLSILKDKVVIFQCTSSYPCKDKEANLNVLQTYKERYNLKVGFSDHTIGTELALVSVGFGCRYIEKHFTLNKKLKGPDHSTSLNYKELKYLSYSLKKTSEALGSFKKKITNSEAKNKKAVRKTYYFQKEIEKNSVIKLNDLIFKRPFVKENSKKIFSLINKRSNKKRKIDSTL